MKRELNRILLLCTLLVICTNSLFAQRISVPEFFIDALSSDPLTEVCSPPGEVFFVRSSLAPGTPLPSNNEYVLELSDLDGNFDNPIELDRVNGPNEAPFTQVDIEFSNVIIPEDIAGDTYRIRVRSTETTNISNPSSPIPIYYYRDDLSLRINNAVNITLCNVTSFSRDLTVDITIQNTSTTVDPSDFEFQWFKGTIISGTLITGVTGPTLTITQDDLDANGEASFYAQIDLGICNAQFNARSNVIRVELIETSEVFIEDGPTFNFCPGDMSVLQSSVTDIDNDYQWFKDGSPIEGAILPMYDLPDNNFQGEYVLEVRYSVDCIVQTDLVTVVNNGSSITVPLLENLIILPNETTTLQITTDAPIAPAFSTYQWFRDGIALTGILPLDNAVISIETMSPGEYNIDILPDDDCKDPISSMTNIYVPIGIGLTINSSEGNDCNNDTISLQLEEMFGFTLPASGGPPQIPLTEEQWSFFDFEWFKDGVATGLTTTTIEISSSEEEASYVLTANLKTGEFTDITSDPLAISFVPDDIVIEASALIIEEEGSVTLSVPQNNAFTYQWYRKVDDQDVLLEGQTANTLEVTENGIYFVIISSAICQATIPEINIGGVVGETEIIPNIITLNNDGINDTWLLPESLFNQEEVEVTIYNIRGQVDFTATNYQNNWPLENSKSQGSDPIYYFIITKNNSVVRKGSITVMR